MSRSQVQAPANLKSYHCERCDKSFVRREHLDRHERSHTKEKPYRCALCPKAFTRRDLLTRHHRLCHLPTEDTNGQSSTDPFPANHSDGTLPGPAAGHQVPRLLNDSSSSALAGFPLPASWQIVPQGPFSQANATDSDAAQAISADIFDNYDWSMVFENENFADIFDPTLFPEQAQPLGTEHTFGSDNGIFSNAQAFPVPSTPTRSLGELSRFGSRLPSLDPEDQHRFDNHRSEELSPWTSANPKRVPLEVSTECRKVVLEKVTDFKEVISQNFRLPSRHALNRFLAIYITGFNEHNPVLHLPTIALDSVIVELFLAIAAIGARYALEREVSRELFQAAKSIAFERIRRWETISGEKQSNGATISQSYEVDAAPIALEQVQVMQALTLMTGAIVFGRMPGAGSHDSALIRTHLCYMIRETAIRSQGDQADGGWMEWIEGETMKRVVLVAFTLLNLQTILLDVPPSLWWSEITVSLPSSEKAWNAKNADFWFQAQVGDGVQVSIQEAMRNLFCKDELSYQPRFSSLGGYFLIHAVLQAMWLDSQMVAIQADQEGAQSKRLEETERALRRWRRGWEQNQESSMNPVNPSGPIAFTSTALLRLAYVRITTTSRMIPWLATWDPNLVATKFLQTPNVPRSERATRAALHCAHALSIPVKIGLNFIAHTQSFYWACQHSLSSLECALFLSKWLDSVTDQQVQQDLSPQENLVLEFVIQIVSETQFRASREHLLSEQGRLSKAVVKIWGKMFPELAAWEVVDLVAEVFQACSRIAESE